MQKKVNKHGYMMEGLKKVAGETQGLTGYYGKLHLQLNYDMKTGELWTNTHTSRGSLNVYDDQNIVVVGKLSDPHTMQEIADKVATRMDYILSWKEFAEAELKKIVYLVEEVNFHGDNFDTGHTFDLEKAKDTLYSEAENGYLSEKKAPGKTEYWLEGYEINLSDIPAENLKGVDFNDPKALYYCWLDEQVHRPDPVYAERFDCETLNKVSEHRPSIKKQIKEIKEERREKTEKGKQQTRETVHKQPKAGKADKGKEK